MFTADWLTLREPADFAARSAPLTRAVARQLGSRRPLHAVDLACGTGANVRYLGDYLQGGQHWLMVDHDQALLDRIPLRMSTWAVALGGEMVVHPDELRFAKSGRADSTFKIRPADLRSLDDRSLFAGRALVTASALLDLVSAHWLEMLAERCRDAGAIVLFALTYDGRLDFSPDEPEDGMVRELVNRHQRTDKGFGLALGPDAVPRCARAFTELGYQVNCEQSDWILGASMSELQRQLIDGWARAAAEVAPGVAASIERWRGRRLMHVENQTSQLIVGHQDVAASLQPIG